jgi:hypothetical protein
MRSSYALIALCVCLPSVGCGSNSGTGDGNDNPGAGAATSGGSASTSGGASSTGGSSATSGGSSTTTGGSSTTAGGSSTTAGGSSTTTGGTTGGNATGATGGDDSNPSGGSGGVEGGGGGIVTAIGCPGDQEPGTWENVTDAGMKMTGDFTNGPVAIDVDVVNPTNMYAHNQHDGTWKSEDCGVTWTKVSTGTNADAQNSGSQWYAAIDRSPNRDPETAPTMYVAQGYGAGNVWKSTNGGVDWTNVWNNNIYAPDGTTNISADVGGDIHEILIPDDSGGDHVLVTLHSYWGEGDNNGVFETTDGGQKWIVHKSETFNFQPHSDILSYYGPDTWIVLHGEAYLDVHLWRTTNGGESWTEGDQYGAMIGRAFSFAGDTILAGTDFNGGAYKSTDQGASFEALPLPANQVSWIVATGNYYYASSGYTGAPHILRAPIDDDQSWTDLGTVDGMGGNGANSPVVIFDGSNYVIVAAQGGAGLWRYVEPAP